MHLDDAQKKLVRELTEAITGTVSESDRIAKAVYKLRAAGINVELSLDGTRQPFNLAGSSSKPRRSSLLKVGASAS